MKKSTFMKRNNVKHIVIALLISFVASLGLTACGTLTYDDYYNIGYTAGSYLSRY